MKKFMQEHMQINFQYSSLIKPFVEKNYTIVYLDMQELLPQYAFETMKKLAKELGFNAPKEKEYKEFEYIRWNKFASLLPCTLIIQAESCKELEKDLELIINENWQKIQHTKDIKTLFCDEFTPFFDEIAILIKNQDEKYLKQSCIEKLRLYFNEFFKVLKSEIDTILSQSINEEQILTFLKENKALSMELKTLFDKELVYIKQNAPQIINSWKYYQKFELLCKEN